MNTLFYIASALVFLSVLCLWREVQLAKRRVRVLGAFIAGLVARELDNGTSYERLLFYISHEFEADFWSEPAQKFLGRDRNLFYSEPMGNGGFNMLFWDFFDREKTMVSSASIPEAEQRVAFHQKLSEFLQGRAEQMREFLRQDYEKELLWAKTGSDDLYNDIRMAEEMKQHRQQRSAPPNVKED